MLPQVENSPSETPSRTARATQDEETFDDSSPGGVSLIDEAMARLGCLDGEYESEKDGLATHAHTPISQISAVAAEVADTAALLDVTPVEAGSPEFVSVCGSPVVELVDEGPSDVGEGEVDGVVRVVWGEAGMDGNAADGQVLGSSYTMVDSGGSSYENTLQGNQYCPSMRDISAAEVEDRGYVSKTDPVEGSESQKDTQRLTPPHLRRKLEPKTRLETSDSESSMMSAMSNLSTDELEKGVSIDNFIDTIQIEDLVTIASDAYAENHDVAGSTITCVVDPSPRIGSRNVFYVAEFSDDENVRKSKWIIRIPLQGRYFSSADKLWLESDIRSMEFIKERTDIPVPYIYAYDNSIQNKIGTPYVLMNFMAGDRIEDVWGDLSEEKRKLCLLQCAESMRKLGRFGFNDIGVLGCDDKKREYVVHGIPCDIKDKKLSLAGPFPSTKSYLDHIWHMKVKGLGSSDDPEVVKNRQSLVLLKLLVPALVDLDPATQRFFLSLPEFGGGSVLADRDGNVTGFVGWERVMIMPRAIGHARYPDWIIKDWTSSQGKNTASVQQLRRKNAKARATPEINRKSLTKASLNSGKTIETVMDNEGVIHGYLLGEGEDLFGETTLDSKPLAFSLVSTKSKKGNNVGEGENTSVLQIDENGASDAPNTTSSQAFLSVPALTNYDKLPIDDGRWKKNKEGRKEGYKNNRGNRQPITRQRQEYGYDENIELQRAVTDEDKTKAHAVSKWNALPEEITRKEAEEREERKQARLMKEEEERTTGIKKETSILPKMAETFKKVVVEPNLERKLLKVVKTERKDSLDEATDAEDTKAVSLPPMVKSSDMVRHRKIYHEFFVQIAPEDEMATKSSHISTAVHTAIINDNLRPSIIPRLAKHIFGAAVGPNLLRMVGGSQWAKESLKVPEDKDKPKNLRFMGGERSIVKGERIDTSGGARELLIPNSTFAIGAVVVTMGVSLFFFWGLGLGKYNIQFTWHENGYTTMTNLSLQLQFPVIAQPPAYENAKAAVRLLGAVLEKAAGAASLALDYGLAFLGAVVLFVVFMTMQNRADG